MTTPPKKTIPPSLEQISILYQQEKYQSCESTCKQLLKKEPKNLTALFMLAGLLLMRKKNNNALSLYKKIVTINPLFPHIHRYIGSCYLELKKYQTANRHFNKNLDQAPQDIETLKAQLELYNKWKKWAKSIPICQHILSQNPQDLEANFAYGLAHFHEEDYYNAIPFFVETLKADETHLQTYKNCWEQYR